MADAEWFYVESGSRRGPVTTQQLARLLQAKLPPETQVWHQGVSGWKRADQLPELATYIPPPLPAQTGSGPPPVLASEERTLNPFRVFLRCFSWKGRFTRAEFAIAYLGNFLLLGGVAFGLGVIMSIFGADEKTLDGLETVLALLWTPFAIAISLGSGVRRLHDLGKRGSTLLLAFVPCVNLIMILYLLFAPSSPGPPLEESTSSILLVVGGAFVVILFLGIIAAIAIPSFLRARVSANESATISSLRGLVAAQMAYARVNTGFYDSRWECLAVPPQCLPAAAGATLLARQDIHSPRAGYNWQMYRGQMFPSGKVPPGLSLTSTNAFAIVASPVNVGQTGVRAFCADSTGTICFNTNGAAEGLVEQLEQEPWIRCGTTCTALQ